MSLWELEQGRPATDDDALIAARALKAVHAALEGVRVDLPPYTDAIDSCERILSNAGDLPGLNPSDRVFLDKLYRQLREELRDAAPPCRPIHGDPHLANALITGETAVWMDLEAVCVGPLEWDLVCLPSAAWSEFLEFDPDLTRLLADLRSVCVTLWCLADLARSAEIRSAAMYHLDVLKARFR